MFDFRPLGEGFQSCTDNRFVFKYCVIFISVLFHQYLIFIHLS